MKVNSISFSGLWEKGKKEKIGFHIKNRIPVYKQTLVYHPFSDETEKEITNQLSDYKNSTWKNTNNRTKAVTEYTITNSEIGDTLSLTKAEYEKFKSYSSSVFANQTKLSDEQLRYLSESTIFNEN